MVLPGMKLVIKINAIKMAKNVTFHEGNIRYKITKTNNILR